MNDFDDNEDAEIPASEFYDEQDFNQLERMLADIGWHGILCALVDVVSSDADLNFTKQQAVDALTSSLSEIAAKEQAPK